jgi:hypothetical protein
MEIEWTEKAKKYQNSGDGELTCNTVLLRAIRRQPSGNSGQSLGGKMLLSIENNGQQGAQANRASLELGFFSIDGVGLKGS